MHASTDFETLRRQHLAWLNARNYSTRTITDREHWLLHFTRWIGTLNLASPAGLSRTVLEAYARHWADHRKSTGDPLAAQTRRIRLIPAKSFCRWLARAGLIAQDPTDGLESLRLMQPLPKCILTHAETEKILNGPMVDRRNGLRDRAMLEMLYSTGIRRAEHPEESPLHGFAGIRGISANEEARLNRNRHVGEDLRVGRTSGGGDPILHLSLFVVQEALSGGVDV